jgi:diguanylate cyclase (GGDEF)-like protein/PAS domain S-box-containing protein
VTGAVAAVEQGALRARPTASHARGVVTLALAVALIASQFVVLNGVYHRADSVRRQQMIQSRLAGQLAEVSDLAIATAMSSSIQAQETTARIDTALQSLRNAGSSEASLRTLVLARQGISAQPQSSKQLQSMVIAVDALGLEMVADQRNLDLQAGLIFGSLLIAISLGWFLWFRRLLTRHRWLQQTVTEKRSLANSEQRLLALVQNGSDVVTVLNLDSTASFVSPSSKTVLGFAAEDLVGSRLVDLIHPDDVRVLVQLLANQRAGGDQELTLRMRHADGRTLVVQGMLTNLLADATVGGFVLTVRDVTERHALQERLTYQAFHDSLTGLANRQLFGDRLAHALQLRPGVAKPLVVLFCDLDDFKNVNDSLGHRVGDRVLEVVGQRIRSAVRVGDTAARLGGDEFAILMESTELDEAEVLAQRLVELIAEPIVIDGSVLPVSASVGMAQAVPGEISTEEALRNADVAMYSAKDRGKSTVAAYDSGLHAEALDRLELRADLQRALNEGELVLHYQPTVELDTGKITGFEALVRWQHPTRGLLAPAYFIPMAEETGMIVQLGTWVLYEACRTAARLQSDWRRPTMAVNISSQQLARSDFVDQVTDALTEAGLHPDRLTLEITEGVVVRDLDTVIPRLAALRACGVRVAIDDFGTGYSSLAYLTKLPVDVLKVDKSFIDRVASDEQGASLTKAIIALSHTMNLTTVAEGVEVAEQAAWLRHVRCPIGQGYYWSRPVDLPGVFKLLARPTNEAGGELGSVTYLTVRPIIPAAS